MSKVFTVKEFDYEDSKMVKFRISTDQDVYYAYLKNPIHSVFDEKYSQRHAIEVFLDMMRTELLEAFKKRTTVVVKKEESK